MCARQWPRTPIIHSIHFFASETLRIFWWTQSPMTQLTDCMSALAYVNVNGGIVVWIIHGTQSERKAHWDIRVYIRAGPTAQSVSDHSDVQSQTAVTAVTTVCLCGAVRMPVPDGRRESCSSKTNSSKLSLQGGQYASTRWQKRILQLKAKQQQ